MHDISFFPYSAKLQTPSKGLDTYSQADVVIHQFLLLPRFPGVVGGSYLHFKHRTAYNISFI